MTLKDFCKSKVGFVVLNGIAALIIGLVLVLLVLGWLGRYARHGEEVQVPDVKGMYVDEAAILVQNEGLAIQVVDSTYSRKIPLGAIVDQNPPADSHAKRDRMVYVVVNAKQLRQVPLPDLRDVSFRQAEATLRSVGLEVGEVEYEPSVYKDLVLDVRHGDKVVEPGTRLPEGTTLILVVGFGAGTEQVRVPDVIGLKKEGVRATLLQNRLILGQVEYDEELTEENASHFVVYSQSVQAGSELLEGSRVDVKMTTSLEKAASASVASSEEDFF